MAETRACRDFWEAMCEAKAAVDRMTTEDKMQLDDQDWLIVEQLEYWDPVDG